MSASSLCVLASSLSVSASSLLYVSRLGLGLGGRMLSYGVQVGGQGLVSLHWSTSVLRDISAQQILYTMSVLLGRLGLRPLKLTHMRH